MAADMQNEHTIRLLYFFICPLIMTIPSGRGKIGRERLEGGGKEHIANMQQSKHHEKQQSQQHHSGSYIQ